MGAFWNGGTASERPSSQVTENRGGLFSRDQVVWLVVLDAADRRRDLLSNHEPDRIEQQVEGIFAGLRHVDHGCYAAVFRWRAARRPQKWHAQTRVPSGWTRWIIVPPLRHSGILYVSQYEHDDGFGSSMSCSTMRAPGKTFNTSAGVMP
jgi:hypothetical protein